MLYLWDEVSKWQTISEELQLQGKVSRCFWVGGATRRHMQCLHKSCTKLEKRRFKENRGKLSTTFCFSPQFAMFTTIGSRIINSTWRHNGTNHINCDRKDPSSTPCGTFRLRFVYKDFKSHINNINSWYDTVFYHR